jgi:hypothetical protein
MRIVKGNYPGARPGQRQRADGTWTFATEEHDARWYWPVGTRVELQDGDRVRAGARKGQRGVVTKQNSVSVWVLLDSGETLRNVPVDALVRL